jgi:hypothetical protein
MSAGHSNLHAGFEVILETNGRQAIHVIVARRMSAESRSGVQYRLMPAVTPEWIDSDKVRRAKGFGTGVDPHADPFEVASAEIAP